MQLRRRGKSERHLPAGALIAILVAAALGFGIAGDAVALDPPDQLRKAGKKTPPAKKNAGPAAKNVPAAKNAAAKNAAAVEKLNQLRKGAKTAPDAKNANAVHNAALSKSNRPHQAQPKANAIAADRVTPNRRDAARTIMDHRRHLVEHRRSILMTRMRLPQRPLPFQRGFTGVPPSGETRFITNEMVFQVGPNVSPQALDAVVRRLGLTAAGSYSSALTGGTVFHFRVAGTRPVADIVRALEAENIGVAQPNYVFRTTQDTAARADTGNPEQYVVSKLKLDEVHRVATGKNVLVAVIDSQIDAKHPAFDGAIAEQFDAVGRAEEPHAHGTGMAGAIAARRQLMGIAPDARILAVHAFSPDGDSPQATTRHILAGLEWAISKGARVINMSFAGPYDPMLALAMKNAHDKGIVLIAAAGNAGPKSPPLYPAADPHVIAVTATDENDKPFARANQGPQVAVAAPGVDILEPAPNDTYQVTTGTSVAAAHVSGVAALLIERNPALDAKTMHEVLTSTAKTLGGKERDDQTGWGLIDPTRALDLDAKVAQDRVASPAPAAAKPAAPRTGTVSAR